jgi:hypothetical protein
MFLADNDVRESSRDDDRDTGWGRSVASLGMLMPTWCTGLCTQLGNATAEAGSGPDTLSEYRIRAPKFASVHSFRNVCVA